MGQAFRRASGRIRASSMDTTPSPFPKTSIDRPPPQVPADKLQKSRTSQIEGIDSDDISRVIADNILEERDPKYDAMLGQMVGRVSTKAGGKLEIGEAFVVEKSNRPSPKLRNTKPESGRYEEKQVPPGTLNVAQLRHILLLHQGKADDHNGPMAIHQIAEKFRVDVDQVQRILQFLSLPPEDTTKQKDGR